MTFKQMTRAYIKEAKQKFEFKTDEAQVGKVSKKPSRNKASTPTEAELTSWIKNNYNFNDKALHAWAEENGWDTHAVEGMIYKIASARIKAKKNETK